MRYNFWNKWLHRLVLGNRIISEFSLDLEIGRTKVDISKIEKTKHVFITGLARSGTTILLRRLYSTDHFSSLTYRDMPFVLMPLFWKYLSGRNRKDTEKAERAHGDGLMVDYDSPEALEEVFWKATCGHEYIKKDRLLPHNPEKQLLEKFMKYIGLILLSRENPSGRYLSKNNNNMLRLGSLCSTLPDSIFIIPFRSPLPHSISLLRQHRLFQSPRDPFATKYMRLLGHFEFGSDHRPFDISQNENPFDPETLAYWLFLWNDIYRWLINHSPDCVFFISYDRMCSDGGKTWTQMMEVAEIEWRNVSLEPLILSEKIFDKDAPHDLIKACDETHDILLTRHEACLS